MFGARSFTEQEMSMFEKKSRARGDRCVDFEKELNNATHQWERGEKEAVDRKAKNTVLLGESNRGSEKQQHGNATTE
jgi:hypothetical protein